MQNLLSLVVFQFPLAPLSVWFEFQITSSACFAFTKLEDVGSSEPGFFVGALLRLPFEERQTKNLEIFFLLKNFPDPVIFKAKKAAIKKLKTWCLSASLKYF